MKLLNVIILSLLVSMVSIGCQKDVLPYQSPSTYQEEPFINSLQAIDPENYRELFDYDRTAPLDIQEQSQRRTEYAAWIDLTFTSPQGGRVPATLVIPHGKGPFAGVLMLHGMPSDRKSMDEIAEFYSRMGSVVLTIDAPFNRPENKRPWPTGDPLTFTELDRSEQIQLIIDMRRAIDLLVVRSEIDKNRLAYLGISYGGMTGGLLAGIEDRIKAYVLVVGDGGLVTHLTGPEDLHAYPKGIYYRLPEEQQKAWIDAMWSIESIHYIKNAAPASLLFQNATQDIAVPPRDAISYQEAGSQPKTIFWYEGGHNGIYTLRFWQDQSNWLSHQVGIGTLVINPVFNQAWRISDWLVITWIIMTFISLVVLVMDMIKKRNKIWGMWFWWMLTVSFCGPVGYLVYWSSTTNNTAFTKNQNLFILRNALTSSVWTANGITLGYIIAIELQMRWLIDSRLAVLFLFVPIIINGLLFQLSRWVPHKNNHFQEQYSRSLSAEFLSDSAAVFGAFAIISLAVKEVLPHFPFTASVYEAPFMVMVPVIAVAGFLTTLPIQVWLVKQGKINFNETLSPDFGIENRETKNWKGQLEVGFYFVLSILVLVAALIVGVVIQGVNL